jgi:rifampin ADP-ribosylating transferase
MNFESIDTENLLKFEDMFFDTDNHIIQLCAHGMELEASGQPSQAAALFHQAWDQASDNFEKCIAAHYLARHQPSTTDKLKWDQLALQHALNIHDDAIKAILPSLYLNIGKCYEDLQDPEKAKTHYQLAHTYAIFLQDDGYGSMMKRGIDSALQRMGAV